MTVKRVLIFGLGLIGGSLARALRAIGVEVYAVDIDPNALSLAEVNDWINQGIVLGQLSCVSSSDSKLPISQIEAIREIALYCEMIVLSAPLSECPKILEIFAGHISERVVVTDIGSVKKPFLDHARVILGESIGQYVSAHPVAGSEKDGVASSRQDLFNDKPVALCGFEGCNENAYALVSEMWKAIGARVLDVEVVKHDRIFSAISHFPHFLAFSSLGVDEKALACLCDIDRVHIERHMRIRFASGRIWAGIFQENKANILSDLQSFRESIVAFEDSLKSAKAWSLFAEELHPSGNFDYSMKQLLGAPITYRMSPLSNFLLFPTIIVFFYLQHLQKHRDFDQLKYFTGSGFKDFICLAENFSCLYDKNVDVNLLRTQLRTFLSNLAIFEDLLVRNDTVALSEKITYVAKSNRMHD